MTRLRYFKGKYKDYNLLKMKKITLFLIFVVFAAMSAMAQQDCPQVDCPGICGRFVDADGDGFCDHGQLSAKQTPETPAEKNTPEPKTPNQQKKANDVSNENTTGTKDVSESDNNAVVEDTNTEAPVATEETNGDEELAEAPKPFRYPLFTILGITLALYLSTSILVRSGKMTKPTHRKIWNVTLAVTFLASCILGLILTFFINYGYRPTCYITLLHWHVYAGIAMTLIAFIHMLWHVDYYKNILKGKRKQTKEEE